MELKVNDILNVSLSINDEESNETKYSVSYYLGEKFYTSADVTMPKDSGYISIEDWIFQDMETFPEISDYEIFDVTDEGESRSAKIKIKGLIRKFVIKNYCSEDVDEIKKLSDINHIKSAEMRITTNNKSKLGEIHKICSEISTILPEDCDTNVDVQVDEKLNEHEQIINLKFVEKE